MLTQPNDVDRMAAITPERWRAYNPFSLTVPGGDLSDCRTRHEYIRNGRGGWRRYHQFEQWMD